MMRSAVVVLWLCALLVVMGALPAARASGVQPVGEVFDHPVECFCDQARDLFT